jgi:hypothetical protein
MNRFGNFLISSFGRPSWEHYVIHGQEPDRLVSACTSIGYCSPKDWVGHCRRFLHAADRPEVTRFIALK